MLGKNRMWVKVALDGETAWAPTVYGASEEWFYLYADASITASTYYIVVDMSDTTNFPHSDTGAWKLHDINGEVCVLDSNTTEWNIRLGIVTRVDATNGDVWWFHGIRVDASAPCDPAGASKKPLFPEDRYLSGELDGATPKYFGGTSKSINSTNWQSDVNLTTFMGQSQPPAVGDLVVEAIEVDGTPEGTLDFRIGIAYTTHD